jgi:hypothetical protein
VSVIFSEDFEGTGVGTWTESGTGTRDFDEASVVGQGSQSLRIVSTGTNDNAFNALSGAVSTAYFHFMWRYSSLTGTTDLFHLRSTASVRLIIRTTATGQLSVVHGSVSASVTDSIPANTWVHIWGRYVQGTGADGVADVEWSATTTRTGSGTQFRDVTTGDATTTVNRVYVGNNANETHTEYFDQIIVDDAVYPDVSGAGAGDLSALIGEPITGSSVLN